MGKENPTLIMWREEHPGQPDPNEIELWDWVVEQERNWFQTEWIVAHPDQQLPDYLEVRKWFFKGKTDDERRLIISHYEATLN